MQPGIIIQARMGSIRLPGKVLRTILDKAVIEHLVERIRRCIQVKKIILATTHLKSDKPLTDWANQVDLDYYCGSENDVLKRLHDVAVKFKLDPIIRITADCPLIDPSIIDETLNYYLDKQPMDYISSRLSGYPRGMDCEVISMQALTRAHKEAKSSSDREHVTTFIHGQPTKFVLGDMGVERDFLHTRWTIDTPEDFAFVTKVFEELYPLKPDFGLDDCVELIKQHPELASINSNIEQKAG